LEVRDVDEVAPLEQGIAEQDFLSVAQVAKQLGVTVSLVQKWRRLGWLPATRLGPADVPVFGYRPADVEVFVRERWNRRRGRPPGTDETPKSEARGPKSQVPSPKSGVERDRPARRPKAPAAEVPQAAPPALETEESPTPSSMTQPSVAPPLPVAHQPPQTPDALAETGEASELRTSDSGHRTSDLSGRPLVLWDGDPSSGKALVLGRFPAGQVERALRTAAAYARRYDALVLGEAPVAGAQSQVLAEWRNGQRVTS